ncbi:MAG: BrnT family toxin [Leptospirillum sp.]
MIYEWDDLKRQSDIAKHGVGLSLAEGFDWNQATDTEDDRREYGETRRVALGFIGARLHVLTYPKGGAYAGSSAFGKRIPREEFL